MKPAAPFPPPSEHDTNPVSRLFFSYVSPTIALGFRQRLSLANLPPLWPEDTAEALISADAAFCARSRSPPSLGRRLAECSRRHLLLASASRAVYSAGQLAMPMMLRAVVAVIVRGESPATGVRWAFALACVSAFGGVAEQQHLHYSMRAGRRARSLATALVFRHCVSLSSAALAGRDPGDVANLLSNDANRLLLYAPQVATLWSAPLQIGIATWLLIRVLGLPSLAGVGLLIALLPMLTQLANVQQRLRARHLPVMDGRVRLCGEAARGMRGLKFAGWERSFLTRILAAREEEDFYVLRELLLVAASISCAILIPTLSTAACFVAVAVPHNTPLLPADAFAALALFNVLRFPLMTLGEAVAGTAQLRVSVQRLVEILETPEVVPPRRSAAAEDAVLHTQDASFWWPAAAKPDAEAGGGTFKLGGVALRLQAGELLAVVAPVGGGKSTLLNGLLGECCGEGSVAVSPGAIGYAAQSPFLLNGTLRENILFGRLFEPSNYAAVIAACALTPDIAALPARDATMIGERGVTLSGGQRARVALARALYGLPRLIMADDVLSALDADTGRAVFAAALGQASISRLSARVLVTHALQYLSQATRVAVLDGGRLVACGTHAELLAMASRQELPPAACLLLAGGGPQEEAEQSRASVDGRRLAAGREAMAGAKHINAAGSMLGEDEEQGLEGASRATVAAYVDACGGPVWLAIQLLLLVLERATYLSTDYLLTTWTSAAHGPPTTWFGRLMGNHPATGDCLVHGLRPATYYASAYVLCCAVNSCFAVGRTLWFARGGARAARSLFISAATAVIRSPLSFFETTPTGRILNRLCADQDILDTTLTTTSIRLTASFAWLCGGIAIMLGVVPPVALPIGLALLCFAYGISRFAACYAQLQRLESNARTPLQVHVQEALAGAASVRAFAATERFIVACDRHCDDAALASAAFAHAGRWFSTRIEVAAGFVLLSVGISAVFMQVSGSLAGLAIMWGTNFSLSLTFFSQSITGMPAGGFCLFFV